MILKSKLNSKSNRSKSKSNKSISNSRSKSNRTKSNRTKIKSSSKSNKSRSNKSKIKSKTNVKSLKQSKKGKKMKGGEIEQYILSGSYDSFFDGNYTAYYAKTLLNDNDLSPLLREFIIRNTDNNTQDNLEYTFGMRIFDNQKNEYNNNFGKNDGKLYIHTENPNLIIYFYNGDTQGMGSIWYITNLEDIDREEENNQEDPCSEGNHTYYNYIDDKGSYYFGRVIPKNNWQSCGDIDDSYQSHKYLKIIRR